MIAIARAVTQKARLVIMDEPTSSLDEREVGILFETIRTLKKNGVAVLFIGHRLDELYEICDRVTIMRDGQTVAQSAMAAMPKMELVRNMLGKELAAFQAIARDIGDDAAKPVRLSVESAGSGVRVRDVSVTVREGEISGLAGLLGSGRTETARIIFGVDKLEKGSIRIDGKVRSYAEPADAIADGIGLVSEDRKIDGIIPDMSIRENMTLALLPKLKKAGIVDRARQQEIVTRYIKALGVKCASPDQPIKELSGGNQQKVLLARWLCTDPRILIIDEPTRGIDIGAKAEILKLLRSLADEGLSVLMISSELEELLAAADRVTVLSDGKSVAVLKRDELSETALLSAMAHQVN
jgi:monosaccharide-transporting ATPase